jgi:hypothetical protein
MYIFTKYGVFRIDINQRVPEHGQIYIISEEENQKVVVAQISESGLKKRISDSEFIAIGEINPIQNADTYVNKYLIEGNIYNFISIVASTNIVLFVGLEHFTSGSFSEKLFRVLIQHQYKDESAFLNKISFVTGRNGGSFTTNELLFYGCLPVIIVVYNVTCSWFINLLLTKKGWITDTQTSKLRKQAICFIVLAGTSITAKCSGQIYYDQIKMEQQMFEDILPRVLEKVLENGPTIWHYGTVIGPTLQSFSTKLLSYGVSYGVSFAASFAASFAGPVAEPLRAALAAQPRSGYEEKYQSSTSGHGHPNKSETHTLCFSEEMLQLAQQYIDQEISIETLFKEMKIIHDRECHMCASHTHDATRE